jgi:hypothetical protein
MSRPNNFSVFKGTVMGMFDYITVESLLPGNVTVSDEVFQTKTFWCLMENYVITKSGEIYREIWEYEWVDNDRHPLGGHEEKLPETYRREYLTDFHGDIIFYRGTMPNGKWRDYTARFTDGKLTRISYEDKQY